jgi:hypothetical protein
MQHPPVINDESVPVLEELDFVQFTLAEEDANLRGSDCALRRSWRNKQFVPPEDGPLFCLPQNR